jgi:hypothetical protein
MRLRLGSLACAAAAVRREALPSCAGAYVSGAAGSNECPAGYGRIETEAACRTAAAAVGMTVPSERFVEASAYFPRGCYYHGGIGYLNDHAVGAGRVDAQLLCAAGTSGAPLALTPRACALASGERKGIGCSKWLLQGYSRDTRLFEADSAEHTAILHPVVARH